MTLGQISNIIIVNTLKLRNKYATTLKLYINSL